MQQKHIRKQISVEIKMKIFEFKNRYLATFTRFQDINWLRIMYHGNTFDLGSVQNFRKKICT